MAQRNSGFKRIPMDLYQTREQWVVDALADHLDLKGLRVWECAAGEGKMVASLQAVGATVLATDVQNYALTPQIFRGLFDFTVAGACPWINSFDFLITNPPYGERGRMAERFIELGLERIGARSAMALLLPVDFDSAKTRALWFANCPKFIGKIVLTRRIRWFDPEPGKKSSSGPSQNHAWFIWGPEMWRARSAPVLRYGPIVRSAA